MEAPWARVSSASGASEPPSITHTEPSVSPPARTGIASRGRSPSASAGRRSGRSAANSRRYCSVFSALAGTCRPRMPCRRSSSTGWPGTVE